MLAELEVLITSSGLDMGLEDVINAALRQYLPHVITTLRRAQAGDERERVLREAEAVIKGRI
jgi:hypothetical protein